MIYDPHHHDYYQHNTHSAAHFYAKYESSHHISKHAFMHSALVIFVIDLFIERGSLNFGIANRWGKRI